MKKYDDWDFKWWGDGDYEKRLQDLKDFWCTSDYFLLCTLDKPFSINYQHFSVKNKVEIILYKQRKLMPGLLTPNLELSLLLNDIYDYTIKYGGAKRIYCN